LKVVYQCIDTWEHLEIVFLGGAGIVSRRWFWVDFWREWSRMVIQYIDFK